MDKILLDMVRNTARELRAAGLLKECALRELEMIWSRNSCHDSSNVLTAGPSSLATPANPIDY